MPQIESTPLDNHGMHIARGSLCSELSELKRTSAIAIWRNLPDQERKLYLRFLSGNLSLPTRTRKLLETLSFATAPASLEDIGSPELEKIVIDSLRYEGEDGWTLPYTAFNAWKASIPATPPKKIS